MGMYTELIFGASFKKDTPKEVIDTLRYMAGDLSEPPTPLLFDAGRNPIRSASFYFAISSSVTKMWYDSITKEWILSSRANIKNYDSEIEKFLEWVKPHISGGSGRRSMYAIVLYEECETPEIHYLND